MAGVHVIMKDVLRSCRLVEAGPGTSVHGCDSAVNLCALVKQMITYLK